MAMQAYKVPRRIAREELEEEEKALTGVPGSFMFIDCPNCCGDGSLGGFTDRDLYTCVEPTCKICNNYKTMVVCYNCNTISQKYIDEDGCFSVCCDRRLAIPKPKCNPSKHKWIVEEDNVVVCEKCDYKPSIY